MEPAEPEPAYEPEQANFNLGLDITYEMPEVIQENSLAEISAHVNKEQDLELEFELVHNGTRKLKTN